MCAAAKPITAWCSAADPAPPLPFLRSLPSMLYRYGYMCICIWDRASRPIPNRDICTPGSWRRRMRLAANSVPAPVRSLPTSWRVGTPPSLLGVSVPPRENARPPLASLTRLATDECSISDADGAAARPYSALLRHTVANMPPGSLGILRGLGGRRFFLAAPTSAGCGWSGIPRSRSAVHAAGRGGPRPRAARPRNGAGS